MSTEDYERQAAWKRHVLAAISGQPTPDEVRESFGLGPVEAVRQERRREALHAGRWVRAGAMEVRLS